MATTWTTESNTQAASTVSTIDTTLTLDNNKSFLIKNQSGINRFEVDNATGNATTAGDLNVGANSTITGTLDVKSSLNLGSNSYMTLTDNEIDVSSGNLTLDVAGIIFLDAANTRITGNLAIDSNTINSYGGETAITLNGRNVTVNDDLETGAELVVGTDLTVNETASFADSSSFQGLATFTSGIKLGNNIIYASDGGTAITLDTSSNATIAGDLTVLGGDITGATDADLAIHSDGNISFILDDDNDETGQKFYFYNDTTEIATLNESGDLQIDGGLTTGGIITLNGNTILSGGSTGGLSTMQASYDSTTTDKMRFIIRSYSNQDVEIALYEGGSPKWTIGNDATGGSSDDLFCIGTGLNFIANKFELDTSGNVTIAGNLTTNSIFLNGPNFTGDSDSGTSVAWLNYSLTTTDNMRFNIRSFGDAEIGLYEIAALKWVIGNDVTGGSSDDLFCIGTDAGFSENKFELDTSGNLKILGQFACNGASPAAAPDYTSSSFSTNRTITGSTSAADTTDVLATLITDLIAIGILQ